MSRKHRRAEDEFAAKGYDRLATYNGERYRGIAHTAEYDAEMAVLQEQFIAEKLAEAERNGWTVIGGPGTSAHVARSLSDCAIKELNRSGGSDGTGKEPSDG